MTRERDREKKHRIDRYVERASEQKREREKERREVKDDTRKNMPAPPYDSTARVRFEEKDQNYKGLHREKGGTLHVATRDRAGRRRRKESRLGLRTVTEGESRVSGERVGETACAREEGSCGGRGAEESTETA